MTPQPSRTNPHGKAGSHPDAESPTVAQRIRASKASGRRQWIFRTGAMLAASAILLCFLVAWRRDAFIVDYYLKAMDGVAANLQTQVDTLGCLPAGQAELGKLNLRYYMSDAHRFYANRADKPVIIAYADPVHLMFHPDGRAVLIYDQTRLRAEWMNEATFDEAWSTQLEDTHRFEKERSEIPLVLP